MPVSAQTRFTALQSGEIDVLVRNTGWSLTREASLGLLFAGVNFWDGTSIIVKTASGVKSVKDLGGATICVLPGTTTELDLADWARAENIKYTPVLIGSINEIRQAFLAGRCDGAQPDDSQGRFWLPVHARRQGGGADHPARADRVGSERRDGAQR